VLFDKKVKKPPVYPACWECKYANNFPHLLTNSDEGVWVLTH
jgi:hypothetical protein